MPVRSTRPPAANALRPPSAQPGESSASSGSKISSSMSSWMLGGSNQRRAREVGDRRAVDHHVARVRGGDPAALEFDRRERPLAVSLLLRDGDLELLALDRQLG